MFSWSDIKSFNGSQNSAFEELVCQLVRSEEIADSVHFRRVAAPDGGVEAYCELKNGEEYGWQAKYFSVLGSSQWKQITESFKTALKTHPKLKKYFICTPLDRQDPRKENQQWSMDYWNKKVEEWKTYAKQQGRDIEFEYWGNSELLDRLSQKKHEGRRHFWFTKDEFSDNWFRDRVQESITNLGVRYSPKINVELDIVEYLDALSRNESFYNKFKDNLHTCLVAINKGTDAIQKLSLEESQEKTINEIKERQNFLKETLSRIQEFPDKPIRTAAIEQYIHDIFELFKPFKDSYHQNRKTNDSLHLRTILESYWALDTFLVALRSIPTQLADDCPRLLIIGEAGAGKSHLLADIASKRIEQDKACILLLGQHFTNETPPMTQILSDLLRLKCSESEFLGALNTKAESQGERILFIIDAINEGKGLYFWPDHIRGFIDKITNYPWLGLVLSVRSSYEALLTPSELVTEKHVKMVTHFGFSGVELRRATEIFFLHYGIHFPSIPLLNPEFSNPLFLKLFCEGLNRSGLKNIPKGYQGISKIIDTLLDAVNKKLSKPGDKPDNFDYPESFNLVKKVIEEYIEYRIANDTPLISYEKAYQIADDIVAKYSNKKRFLDTLISEGVLTKNLYHRRAEEPVEVIYLAYERFDDHFMTSFLLDKHLDLESPDKLFADGGAFNKYLNDPCRYQGIIESLFVQFPERTNTELYAYLSEDQKTSEEIMFAFIDSLYWRKTDNISHETRDYANNYILKNSGAFNYFFQMMYSVAGDPGHFYNAERLHHCLMPQTLADRDAFWTTYIHHIYDQEEGNSSFERLISWAHDNGDKWQLTEESRLLTGIALSWLLTSTSLYLRDQATIALAVLLKNYCPVMKALLIRFESVNDPYVYERIFAAAYSAVLNSNNLAGLDNLSAYIVDTIFKQDEVYPNVLIRDYARNIVEYALYKKAITLPDGKIIQPPYRSAFPESFPSNDEIDSLYARDDRYYLSQLDIISSMTTEYGRGIGGYGDFGRYTFQSALSDWRDRFDPQALSNYACNLIFEKYGYDVEKHGEFDQGNTSPDRYTNKKERIGKKYQWLALYETLARISDNHEQVNDSFRWEENKKYTWYEGPWNPFVRDIDPTRISAHDSADQVIVTWKNTSEFIDWEGSDSHWKTRKEALPDPIRFITADGFDQQNWLVLEQHLSWNSPLSLGEDSRDISRKKLWYQIRSCLVKKRKAAPLREWLSNDPFSKDLPESSNLYQVFEREYF